MKSRSQRAADDRNKRRRKKRWYAPLGAAVLLLLLAGAGWKALQLDRGTSSESSAQPGDASPSVTPEGTEKPGSGQPSEPPVSASPEASAEPDAAGSPLPVVSALPGVPANPSKGTAADYAPLPDDPDRVSMAFVGDVIFASTVEGLLKKNGYDYPYLNVKSALQQPDLTVANLETPITERGDAQKKEYVYKSSPAALPAFKEAGVDLVNLANNHSMDMGREGLADTMRHLDDSGILRVGAGKDIDEAFKPVVVERKGMKIAFLGFTRVLPDASWRAGKATSGLADTYNYTLPVKAVENARKQADLVVVIGHWGLERKDTPEPYQAEMAHRYIDAGADLVIGGHPHVLQGLEQYKGKWIMYSLGNFIFTTNNVAKTLETVVLRASCSKDRNCSVSALPIFTKWAQPAIMSPADGKKLFDRLSGISTGVKVNGDGTITKE